MKRYIVELPVEIGQKVYFVYGNSILTYRVDIIEIQRGYIFFSLSNWEYDDEHRCLSLPKTAIGSTLFLTMKEAEEKLNRLQEKKRGKNNG